MQSVYIKLLRVQTWLFSVPRLRAMVGANTLLGEVLRVALPQLARQDGRWTPGRLSGDYPTADPDDPLGEDDNPAADAEQGILSRDGGHFEAVFSSGAKDFAHAAAALLRRKLPGLRFQVFVDRVEQNQASTRTPRICPSSRRVSGPAEGSPRSTSGSDGAARARLFHRNRVLLRRALHVAMSHYRLRCPA